MSHKTDMRHGRQGGRFLPDNYEAVDFDQAPHCDMCGGLMVVGQHERHHLCDPETMVGRRCTCPPGCTLNLVGDGDTCADDCTPCRINRNKLHSEVDAWTRSR